MMLLHKTYHSLKYLPMNISKFKYSILLFIASTLVVTAQTKKTIDNVVLVTLDGMRWQDVFHGADSSFFKQQKHLSDDKLKEKYWRDDLNARRLALMPFLWGKVAKEGTLLGNRDRNSLMNVTNQMWFSYPGYNELLTGQADDARINSNDANPNPNVTVLEVINANPSFKGKVAAFTSWDAFPAIINDKRSGIFVSGGIATATGSSLTEAEKSMNKVMTAVPAYSGTTRIDAFTFYYGLEYIKKNKPRVVYFSFDETDHFSHGGEYAAYLNSARATDAMLAELWDYLQSDPQYKGKTTLIITVDHGRGDDAENWKHHGRKIDKADQIWLAAIGAGIKNNGESTAGQFFQNQVAQTVATLLGVQFQQQSGKVLPILAEGK
jgi:hypothetical protein